MTPWDVRIDRAKKLAAESAPVAEMLAFYARLAAYQQSLASTAGPGPGVGAVKATPFVDVVDLQTASQAVAPFIAWLQEAGPVALARSSAALASVDVGQCEALMRRRLAHLDFEEPLGFIIEAALQPFAEVAAQRPREHEEPQPDRPATGLACCPICGSPPVVGVLREEGHGAKRTLVCSLCFTEWDYLRVVCPACDEKRFDALPVYTADAVPHVRLDACDTCHVYLKTLDLTTDGLAVPMVDDLATVSLDLWARESGYRRLYPSLLRL